ncbi:MAG: manganese efflux pump MntP family protein [Dehalococcoidia bacterium]|nr:manganese efflux pump MntP family protein [Dehalococcoidia bacterium]
MDSLNFVSVFLIAVGLSADCFAVAIGGSASMKTFSAVQVFRISIAFGAAQALMPVFGWLAGRTVVDIISAYDHWVAFVLLAAIGGKMIRESFHSRDVLGQTSDITTGFPLLALSVATSIDALAVGLTFAFLEVNIALATATIGIVAFMATAMGFFLGKKANRLVGKGVETFGGLVLMGIGFRIVLTHML